MTFRARSGVVLLALGVAATPIVVAQTPPPTQTPPTQAPPVPKPFPGSNPTAPPPAKPAPPPAKPTPPQTPTPPPNQPTAPPAQTPATPASPVAAPAGAPTEALLGVKLFPGSEFLESFDGGTGQRIYLFGTNTPYADVVAFYRRELKGGTELFKEPAMQQFDLPGVKYQKDIMATPPGVVVKDYTWSGVNGGVTPGFVFVDGTTPKRFFTVVQIVSAPPVK